MSHNDARAKSGFANRAAKLLNAPLTVTLTGFLLTGVIGAFLTEYWQEAQRQRDENAAEVSRQKEEFINLREVVTRAITDREIASDEIIDALERKSETAYTSELWEDYKKAYQRENKMYLTNHINLEAITDNGAPNFSPQTVIFWRYLDLIIQPRFEDLHNCILGLRAAYNDRNATNADLAKKFQNCDDLKVVFHKAPGKWVFYWDQFNGDSKGVREHIFFDQCLELYTYYLDWFVRLQSWSSKRNLLQSEESSHWYSVFLPHDSVKFYNLDVDHEKEQLLKDLPDLVSQDCGECPAAGLGTEALAKGLHVPCDFDWKERNL